MVNDPEESTAEVIKAVQDMGPEATCGPGTRGPRPPKIESTKSKGSQRGSKKALKEAAEKIYAEYPRKVGKQAAITKLIPLIQEFSMGYRGDKRS